MRTDTIGQRIKYIREENKLTQKEFAASLGISNNYVSEIESDKKVPSAMILNMLELRYEIYHHWFIYGGPIEKYRIQPEAIPEEPTPLEDFIFVPMVAGKISAGGGLVADNTVEMRLAFRKDWIQRHGNPKNMSLIRVTGDSMEPTLWSGDIVLVDHNRSFIDPQGGIYAIHVDGEIMIKRLQLIFTTKKLMIISDNKDKYQPIEAETEQIHINGKVIWFGREIER